mgnify:FL=1
MTTGARLVTLLDYSPSWMSAADWTTHDATSKVMTVINSINVDSFEERDDIRPRIVFVADVFILYFAFEERVGFDEPLGADVVVAEGPDEARGFLFVLTDLMEEALLGVSGGIDVTIVTLSFEFHRLGVKT